MKTKVDLQRSIDEIASDKSFELKNLKDFNNNSCDLGWL